MSRLLLVLASALCVGCTVSDAASNNPKDSTDVAPSPAPPVATAAPLVAGSDAASDPLPQSASAVEYFPASMLSHVADSLARGTRTGHTLGARPTYLYLQIRRRASGVPEVHDRWTDLTFVQAGRGSLVSGGRVSGSHLEGAGEHRGGTIDGGSTRPVGAGDFMVIRAGTPHQYVIASGDSLRYLTVKVAASPDGR